MPRRGSWTTIISSRCLRCSRKSTVRLRLAYCAFAFFFFAYVVNTCLSARERMIGWYQTGPKLRAADLEINELFKRFIARPVMVIVDVRPHTVGIPTDAYFAVEEIKDVRLLTPSTPLTHLHLTRTRIQYRTAQRRARRSCTRHLRSKQKRLKKSASSIY